MSLRAVGGPARPGIVPQAGLLVGGQVLAGVVAFATTPIIALGLGAEQYGLYTLLFLFLGYATALDLGLSYSLIKHIAEHDPERERAEIESLVNNAAAVYATVAVLSVVVLALGRGWIAHALLRLPARLVPTAETAALLIACSLPFTAALTMFGAV
ncbi:MAG TPA: oligosaccharide flippase family protein, partial [Gemmatimonadales bacterium]|nr:oligosaccharide flippase family protein [Gemmatimonadales bacterium]